MAHLKPEFTIRPWAQLRNVEIRQAHGRRGLARQALEARHRAGRKGVVASGGRGVLPLHSARKKVPKSCSRCF